MILKLVLTATVHKNSLTFVMEEVKCVQHSLKDHWMKDFECPAAGELEDNEIELGHVNGTDTIHWPLYEIEIACLRGEACTYNDIVCVCMCVCVHVGGGGGGRGRGIVHA